MQADHLTAYQDDNYVKKCNDLVARVAEVERGHAPGRDELARAVARYYAKLLAYKDEYEVARLYGDRRYWQALGRKFAKGYKLPLHLAPPLRAERNSVSGETEKREFG